MKTAHVSKVRSVVNRKPLSVQEMVERGIPIRDAVKAELGRRDLTLTEWALAIGHSTSSVSRTLSRERVSYEAIREQLCRTFHLDRDWLDAHLASIKRE